MLYILAIFTVVVARGENFSGSEFINRGVELPRSEIIPYDVDGFFEDGEKMSTLYVKPIEGWQQQGDKFSTQFTAPFKWLGRQQYLRIFGAMAAYSVEINGVEVAQVMDGSALVEVDITKALRSDESNTITLTLGNNFAAQALEGWSTSRQNPIGEAYIFSQPTQMVRDVSVESQMVGEQINVQITVAVKSHALNSRMSTISCALTRESGDIITSVNKVITQSMRGEESFILNASIPVEEAWSGESTNFMLLQIKVVHQGRNVEFQTYTVGVRDARISESGVLTLNGEKVDIQARQIDYNFNADDIYDIKEKGFNTVIIGAGGYNRALYDACDREGLYVISTAPINTSQSSQSLDKGGNPTNDPRWREAYEQRVERHIYTTRMHPSIIAYAIAEESLNGYNLYESYLKAKDIAGSRGVIYLGSAGEWNSDKLDIHLDTK